MEPWFAPASGAGTLNVEAKRQAEELVTAVAARLREKGLTVDTVVREGDPRMLVVDEAENWNADRIVVGSHGYSGVKRLLLARAVRSRSCGDGNVPSEQAD